ncbi:MAG: peroxidase [Planctomycetaceae bacterium]
MSAVKADYRTADLEPAMRALLDVCVLSTRKPWAVTAGQIDGLRAAGFSDQAIHDAFQVVGYFNYINRIADGLGVELEPEMPAMPANWERD